jgi:hypothetical protein
MGFPYTVGCLLQKYDDVGMVKAGDNGENEGAVCGLGLYCCQTFLKKPTTCCSGETHCCCFYSHGACCSFSTMKRGSATVVKLQSPCNPRIAKVCAVCGLAVFPVVGCCKSLGEVNTAAGSPAPVDLEMVR